MEHSCNAGPVLEAFGQLQRESIVGPNHTKGFWYFTLDFHQEIVTNRET